MEVIHKIGRRKKSVARLYLSKGKGAYTINGKSLEEYFPTAILQYKINQPFTLTETLSSYDIKVNVYGGGTNGQAESIRLAISRALCEIDEEYRPLLKKEGLMTRDPRMVERKKFGQKKARKKFQFSKR
ncbi:MAG: 30S ribosomal protein S9 [Bacteroidetes bacterium]|jgi:small subunit ribosomal protein S9|nr:MAG: 30S ribosomal protein S9 [Cryomorphaceae bacterium BACL29 MAG-121220-bin8]MDA0757223.1 30S ribosomal protein S9 [Bacteroidota bacterium]MDA1019319.1 30S ribosomal protein S9 [Bacteroidota bacterium]|tara:strand:- start:36845 stop:37231 length:387 start_codon:yes stop_codon:yes gene_type:complete